LTGISFSFANTAVPSVNKTLLEKSANVKKITIVSITYDDNYKCIVKASYSDTNGNSGNITVTATTCQKAAQAIAAILGANNL